MTERWHRYLTDLERETMRDIETAACLRMGLDDERRRREAEADPLLGANGGDGPWAPSPDYGDDDDAT